MIFDYTTDITLLELANLDRPILRRLMIEAPGTYHHSVIVGTLVEAAASEIGANPLLARVCGYYHDIGKVNKPLYFIENQKGKNKHDKLAPSMSSLILIAHVKDGVEIARKNKLGSMIIDTIKQHHGTSLIKFFYEKAKQRKGEDSVNIDDFRYPGPKPQTREAGLVMLADAVEAASRTLENPTSSRIQGLVQNLINKIFSDGQLDACELTLKDLHNIAKSFNQILSGIYHHRIEYPDQRAAANGNVQIDNRQDKLKIPLKKIQKTARAILNALDFPDGELSILVVDDQQIAKLNLTYLNRKGPTNVIAFPMREGQFNDITPNLLGDVVISLETAQSEANAARTSLQNRFNELLIHGILHLLGYDHEQTREEAERMQEKSTSLLAMLEKAKIA
jgi:rRNA maturation RNase YbeY